ncbi:protein phosphatase 2C domain-containing protein [Candidatus Uhrbacteria bacterium]|nr:protein phosphatase 2C domain-containing protein [Candidatus Uhrbacteria bacterium]
MRDQFAVAGGSIAGRDHTRAGRNNHDAFSWIQDPDWTIAFVADGCGGADDKVPMDVRVRHGAGPHSEVGAKLGVRLVAESVRRSLRRFAEHPIAATGVLPEHDSFWERIRQDVLAGLRVLALQMGDSLSEVVNEYFLFTLVGAVITKWGTSIVSLGDGIYGCNGNVRVLGPYPDNEPPYLAYGLVPTSLANTDPRLLKFVVHEMLSTDQVHSILLGTDGGKDLQEAAGRCIPGSAELVGPLDQFWMNDLYFRNPDALRRRLAVINRDRSVQGDGGGTQNAAGLLPDDTTLIAIRRRSGGA